MYKFEYFFKKYILYSLVAIFASMLLLLSFSVIYTACDIVWLDDKTSNAIIIDKDCDSYTLQVENSKKTKIYNNCKDYNIGEEIPVKYIIGRFSEKVYLKY